MAADEIKADYDQLAQVANRFDMAGDFSGLYQQVGQKHFKAVVVGPENGVATVFLQVYNT